MRPGVFLPALLLTLPAIALGAGRIAGTLDFKGRAPKPQKAATAEPACKGAVQAGEQRALVRLTRNAPPGRARAGPVVLEQKGCTFQPGLQGAVRGQKILLRNADGTTHSVRAEADGRVLFNVIQPAGAAELPKDPLVSGVVKISCDLHPWMKAFVVISDHPYFTVTADDGTFELNEVPAGAYGIEAWHERLGTARSEVVVEDGKSVDPKLIFIGR